jgi:radical SAM protein with 4Fe4S-binding SPASM domain
VLNQNLGRALIEAGLDRLQCSFDSLIKEDYEKVQVNADFNKTLTNILFFLKDNHDLGGAVFVSISRVESGLVRDKKEDFEKFWYNLPVDNVFVGPLSNLQGKSPMTEQITIPNMERPLCIIPWMGLSIKAGGEITPCSHDYDNEFVIGQMGKDKLVDVWNNEKIRTLRRNLINKEFGKITSLNCAGCNNPFIGYSAEDYISGFYRSLSRWVLAFGKKAMYASEDATRRYKNLIKVLKDKGYPLKVTKGSKP